MNEKRNLIIDEVFALAIQNHQKNNIEVAEKLYNEALKINLNHVRSIYYLGTIFAQKKNLILQNNYLIK